MANTTEGKVFIGGAGTDPAANQKLYDDWAANYERDVRDWGYTMPEDCAKMLKKHTPEGQVATSKIFDAGAGDGLSGKGLLGVGFKEILGCDLSPELVKLAEKQNIYKTVEVADLSKPLKFKTDQFDAATVVGVMTYLEPTGVSLDELCRVVRPGGLVLFTHRTDKVEKWAAKHQQLIADKKWEKVEITEPMPYLPGNPEYGEKVKTIIHVFRVCKKPVGCFQGCFQGLFGR